ncbi:hypothetical protein ACPXCE_19515 [Streptomyces sp. DT24]|uniref:hypothetical protein n=1 Tax=Streptomyces sp. DT24 TaxID=3416520 RepID=UPI003CEF1F88
MNMRGKAQPSSPFPIKRSDHPAEDDVFRVRHPWCVYRLPDTGLESVMNRLRKGLPSKGWKIVKDGPDDSRAKAPQIVANSGDGQVSADLRLHMTPAGSEYESAIEVTVVSLCFHDEAASAPTSG